MSKVSANSELSNRRADPNKRVGRDYFFDFLHGNCKYGGNFSHLLHEKLKVWWVEKIQTR
jgi:hypothetical protein